MIMATNVEEELGYFRGESFKYKNFYVDRQHIRQFTFIDQNRPTFHELVELF